jgi:hypothetical protein
MIVRTRAVTPTSDKLEIIATCLIVALVDREVETETTIDLNVNVPWSVEGSALLVVIRSDRQDRYFALPVALQDGFELRRRGRVIEPGMLWNDAFIASNERWVNSPGCVTTLTTIMIFVISTPGQSDLLVQTSGRF